MASIENRIEITEDEFDTAILNKINSRKDDFERFEILELFMDKECFKSNKIPIKYYKTGDDVIFELIGKVESYIKIIPQNL